MAAWACKACLTMHSSLGLKLNPKPRSCLQELPRHPTP